MSFTKEDKQIQNEGSWMQKTVLFADGKDGAAMQVHWFDYSPAPLGTPIMADGVDPTPISAVWTRKSRKDQGKQRFFYREDEVADFNEARERWVAEGKPLEAPPEPASMLARVA